MPIDQEQRNSSYVRVLKAVMTFPGDGSVRPGAELRSALEAHVQLLEEDLRTRYNGHPDFGAEDEEFLTGEIEKCQRFLTGSRGLDQFKKDICYYDDFPDLNWYGYSNPEDPLKRPE